MSTPFSLAYSRILLLGLTLNPIIKAFEAAAKTISLSVIAPILLLITLTFIPSTSSFSKEFLTASSLPLTSALRITLISFSPASILPNKSSKETEVLVFKLFFLAIAILCSEIALAFFSFSKAINLSPAAGLSLIPVIDTGIEGVASTRFSPLSFFKVLILPA